MVIRRLIHKDKVLMIVNEKEDPKQHTLKKHPNFVLDSGGKKGAPKVGGARHLDQGPAKPDSWLAGKPREPRGP